MRKIIDLFKTRYFSPMSSLSSRVFMIFLMEMFVLSSLDLIMNVIIGYGSWGLVMQGVFTLFCLAMFFVRDDAREKLQKPLLLSLIFVFFPFLFFESAGYDGTVFMFGILLIFMVAFLYDSAERIWVIALALAVHLGCVLVSYHYPRLATPHEDPETKVVDFFSSYILCIVGMGIMTTYVNNAYEKKNHELEDMSIRDPLTGVFNRRYLSGMLKRDLAASKNNTRYFAVMMLDIDRFKVINDTYGHGFGDEVLCALVKTLHKVLRRHDILARYGGEEFAVLLYDIEAEAAFEVAERARVAVENMQFRNGHQVTASIGLSFATAGDDNQDVLNRADKCLYEAKQGGRNKVVDDYQDAFPKRGEGGSPRS